MAHQSDAIVLDLMMPDRDGRATLQRLKTNPVTRSIPVIPATAKVQPSGQESFVKLEVVAVFVIHIKVLDSTLFSVELDDKLTTTKRSLL